MVSTDEFQLVEVLKTRVSFKFWKSHRSKFFNGHESSVKKASWSSWKKALAPKDIRWSSKKLESAFRLYSGTDEWCEGGKLRIEFPIATSERRCQELTSS
ncbi:hypothetical protein Tco_0356582 [Tanacetum coccineum]